jgi:hypothetical protein
MPLKIMGLLIPLLGVMVTVGCGEKVSRGHVSGRLTLAGGNPVVGVTVVARSAATGKSASGTTDGEGKFELGVEKPGDGLPPGDYTVTVLEVNRDMDNPKPKSIHHKYSEHSTSGLSFSVADGEHKTFDAELEKP